MTQEKMHKPNLTSACSPLDFTRRRLLHAGAAASALLLPSSFGGLRAQTEGTVKLLRTPKFALVVGNGNYKRARLQNPANDAQALGKALTQAGFDVTIKLDAGHAELSEAVQSFTQLLAKRKGVGVFYFAGHGLQLAWRNYMIPVDADIRTAADILKHGVEVGTLLSGITKAANPLNVIILDACRDNPFGSLSGLDHKGLSQMDAPPGTLLAYSTAPGNVSSDGDGANGLYTEHLLKEIAVPEAKVEDVFKRVRLGVRRRSNGLQIPWESTSLEDDFYFLPPKALKKISEQEEKRLFQQELAFWEKIKESKDPAPLVDYLTRYPSGKFSEVAQFQLDRTLARQGEQRIQIASSTDNPFTKGTIHTDTRYRIGDVFRYRITDLYTKLELRTVTRRVTAISENEIIFNNGSTTTDFLGNITKVGDSRFSGSQFFIPEYNLGKRWSSRSQRKTGDWPARDISHDFKVAAKEPIVVPAGTFDTYRIESSGWAQTNDGTASVNWQNRYWLSPDVPTAIAWERLGRFSNGYVQTNEREELLSYQRG
jgi:Caspase domain